MEVIDYQVDKINGEWDFWSKWSDGRWEPHTLKAINAYVKGGTYVDVGAWIGPTVIWAAKNASRVVAFEPDPLAFEMLNYNTSDLLNVERYHEAVGIKNGTTRIQPSGNSMSRTGSGKYNVPCYTIDSLFMRHDVREADLIKIDIEGAERELFEHSADYLWTFGSPILLSLHPWAPWPRDFLSKWERTELTPNEWLVTPK